MEKKFLMGLAMLFLLIFGTGPANASLVGRDYAAPGDGLVTFDDATGLEWLDLTQTRVTRPVELQAVLSPGGWQIATRSQVDGLMGGNLSSDHSQISEFIHLFGSTYDENGPGAGSVLIGRFLDGGTSTSMDALRVRDDHFTYGIIDAAGTESPDSFSGTLFVRTASPVPVPASLQILSLGLLGLVIIKRNTGDKSRRDV